MRVPTARLSHARTNEGWETKRDESSGDIEIDFRRGDVTAELGVEPGNDEVELEMDRKVTGPIPN